MADWDWLPGRALVEGVGGTCVTIPAGGVNWHIAGNATVVSEIQHALSESMGAVE